jgi:hypothetical protein
MGVTVYAKGNGAIRARIEASGSALALFRTGERNRIIRDALISAGNSWIAKFLPSRFTSYVQRQPFNYPRRPVGLAVKKLRGAKSGPLAAIWMRIKGRDFFGWDPFEETTGRMPRQLVDWWVRTNPGRYNNRRYIGGHGVHTRKQIYADIRAWARKKAREYAANLAEDGTILPLVQTGDLRRWQFGAPTSRAVATSTRARLTITMPRGDRQNKIVGRMLGTLPVWEFNEIKKYFGTALSAGLSGAIGARMAGSATGRSVGAGASRPVATGGRGPGLAA